MGHTLQDYTRRNGKMKIEFTEGKPRPLNPLHAAKLSSECGVAVRKKLPIPLHWKEFKTEELKHAIPSAIKGVAVSTFNPFTVLVLIMLTEFLNYM